LQNTAGVTVAGVDANGNGVGGLAHPPTFKNLIINGAMQVHQRGTSVTGITAASYNTADRWRQSFVTLGTWTQTVENDAPTGSGFRKSLKVLCTTADASPAAGDFMFLTQRIEGQNLQQIAKGTSSAKQLTVSFWIKSNVTGTYIAEISDEDNTRQVSKSYTISASATWEKKTITFPADTTGALDNDNANSLQLNFWLGAGTDSSSGTLNTSWASTTNANRAVGQTNLAAATNNYWQITGVQLEVGSTATEFEFLPADVELAQCQRYYFRQTNGNPFMGHAAPYPASSTTQIAANIYNPVFLRALATSVEYANVQLSDIPGTTKTISAVALNGNLSSQTITTIDITSSTLTSGTLYYLRNNNNTAGYVGISAEL
jgi:hypothetical protein